MDKNRLKNEKNRQKSTKIEKINHTGKMGSKIRIMKKKLKTLKISMKLIF